MLAEVPENLEAIARELVRFFTDRGIGCDLFSVLSELIAFIVERVDLDDVVEEFKQRVVLEGKIRFSR